MFFVQCVYLEVFRLLLGITNGPGVNHQSDSTIRAYSLPNLIEVRLAASLQVRWNILRKKNAEPAITVCRPMRAGLAIWIAFVRDITGKAGNGPHSVRQACGMV